VSDTPRTPSSPPRVPDGWPPTDAESPPEILWIPVRHIPWEARGAAIEHIDVEERVVALVRGFPRPAKPTGPVRVEILDVALADPPVMLLPAGWYDTPPAPPPWALESWTAPSTTRTPYPARDAGWEWERINDEVRRAVAEFLVRCEPGLYVEEQTRVTVLR
jgi:hypothetical protein